MDPALYKAATQGNIQLLKLLLTADPKTLLSVTPQQNTALHIASRLGNRDIAARILRESEGMLVQKNIDGDTPLHLASKYGKMAVVDLLINYSIEWPLDIESQEGAPLKIVNNIGNAALHEAITHGKSEVALRLLQADPDVGRKLNRNKEGPLHLAAKEGMIEVVRQILSHPWVEEEEEATVWESGSPLHQAVLGGHIKIVEMLLDRRADFVRHVDNSGNNALHYAAQKDNAKMAEMLVSKDSSLAYFNNHHGQPPLQVAIRYGSTSFIKDILRLRPDTIEQLNTSCGNALHMAVDCGNLSSLKCLLKCVQSEEIINYQDCYGNTPLHLAALLSRTQLSLLLIRDKRVDPCKLNYKGQTARSAIETLEYSIYNRLVWRELRRQEEERSNIQLPPITSSTTNKRDYFELSVATYTLVAALIATVTFAAMFTMPGGYDNKTGTAILAKSVGFKIFVISNTIAMCSALVVVFCFIWAWRDPDNFLFSQLTWGHRLTVLACLCMIISLMTAVFLMVESESRWLAIIVIFIGCSTPVVVWRILGYEVLFVPVINASLFPTVSFGNT